MTLTNRPVVSIVNVICDYSFSTPDFLNLHKYGPTALRIFYPTLRIFGILPDSGKKCCAHVHGYLPYVIIRNRSKLTADLHNYLVNLLKDCIAKRMFESKNNSKNGSSSAEMLLNLDQLLFGIFEERGRSLYGFHEGSDYFVRIYFYNPLYAKAFAVLLQKECERLEWLQPYNIHIPFTLQFFIDFSLHGMDKVHFKHVFYRRGDPSEQFSSSNLSPLEPVSSCAVEFDAYTDAILNPWTAKENRTFESIGLDFIWREEQQRCAILKMTPPSLPKELEGEGGGETGIDQPEGRLKEEFSSLLKKLGKRHSDGANSAEIAHQMNGEEEDDIGMDSDEEILYFNNSENDFDDLLDLEEEDSRSSFDQTQQIWENEEYRSKGFDVNESPADEDLDKTIVLGDSSSEDEVEVLEVVVKGKGQASGSTGKRNKNNVDVTGAIGTSSSVDDGLVTICPRRDVPLSIDKLTVNVEMPSTQTSTSTTPKRWPRGAKAPNFPSPRTPLSLGTNLLQKSNVSTQQEHLLRAVQSSVDHLCALSMELLAFPSNHRPIADPKYDQIHAVTFAYHRDICNWQPAGELNGHDDDVRMGGILVKKYWLKERRLMSRVTRNLILVETEEQLLRAVENFVTKLDPELLVGYDTKRLSWGYLFERAQTLRIPLSTKISRTKAPENNSFPSPKLPETPFHMPHGRLILEVWWNVRKDRPLRCFRFANVVKELLHRKFPAIEDKYMAELFDAGEPGFRTTLFNYFLRKTALNLELLAHMDLFVRTSQMARVYGIQFEGVLTRGSQFRVESMLLRIASQRRYFAPSVSVDQRTKMASPECIPLTMEPQSGIYRDPVVLLDFQSLYPSIAIAHNFCYSTCLGKIRNYQQLLLSNSATKNAQNTAAILEDLVPPSHSQGQWIQLGALPYSICPIERLSELYTKGQLTFAPNGAVFVRRSVRRGLLAILLQELLDTRVMVKTAMKMHRADRKMTGLLDARQLALKLIANVTYGYTAANWSGRMPCEEVADAIVSKGRETLERAIASIDGCSPPDKYRGARVIYGDTDSLFILCKGCTRQEAFAIGQQIAEDVTTQNPPPMKLKFEKVMHPCCLLAKKRYMGMCYESPDEQEGKFDAKGIETIRRDSPPFVARELIGHKFPQVMEHFLRLLFDESTRSALRYLEMRLARLDRAELDEFFCSVDFVGGYAETSKSVANKLGMELTLASSRLTPLYGERLVYVICAPRQVPSILDRRPPTLYSSIFSVDKFLRDPSLHLDFDYYVKHQLAPALQRVLDLVPIRLELAIIKPHLQCASCQRAGSYPMCDPCAKCVSAFRAAYSTKMASQNSIACLERICLDCVQPIKALNIEALEHCSNHSCPVKRRAAALIRLPLAQAFEEHKITKALTKRSSAPPSQ